MDGEQQGLDGSDKVINCYNIGNITFTGPAGGSAGGIVSYPGAWCYNCYNIGTTAGIGTPKIIIGSVYRDKRAIHCFARRGDKDSFADDAVLTDAQILAIIGGKNAHECQVLFDSELKEEEFVSELNKLILFDEEAGTTTEPTEQNVWKVDENNINNGYPIFVWQEEVENVD